jgi:hypothetical protein
MLKEPSQVHRRISFDAAVMLAFGLLYALFVNRFVHGIWLRFPPVQNRLAGITATTLISPWPESVVSSAKLARSASNTLHRDTASRVAGIAARTGSAALRRRTIASASIKLALPSNQIEDVSVDLPDPFGPAITVNVGTLFCERRDFAEYPEMSFCRSPRLQADRKHRSVRQFLNVPARVVNKDDRKAGSERMPACAKTRPCSCLGELLGQNIGGRHQP